ncbi:ATP-binding cassette domain-containing protein [Spirillospora sp. NPDC047279]|uniref:ABC transporter ATP-binding protein n=1 Tax=Spirillospora sp. NPDC047279 TaxID=3155478 RepID=UPI0033E3BCA0
MHFATALRRGPHGRLLLALRDSHIACATLGVDTRAARAALFAGPAGLTGLAAALLDGVWRESPAAGPLAVASLLALVLAAACAVVSAGRGRRRRTTPGHPDEGLCAAGLEAPPGTVTGLIGPAGAGKTMFLDAVTGLRRPPGGPVRLGGADLGSAAPHVRARLGMARTFQRPEPFGSLSVRGNVLVAAEIHAMTRETPGRAGRRGWRRRRQARREAGPVADRLLERVGIAGYAACPAARVPPWAARLLDLARALATEPRLLLLDEPFSGLPVPAARSLECLLRDLAAEGVAVLLVEHDLETVMGVCDVLCVLDRGELVSHGPPVQVRADPRVHEAYLGRPAAGDGRPGAPVAVA